MIKVGTEDKILCDEYKAKKLVNLGDTVIFDTGQGRSIMDGTVEGITLRGLHVRLLSLSCTIFVKWCNIREILKGGK